MCHFLSYVFLLLLLLFDMAGNWFFYRLFKTNTAPANLQNKIRLSMKSPSAEALPYCAEITPPCPRYRLSSPLVLKQESFLPATSLPAAPRQASILHSSHSTAMNTSESVFPSSPATPKHLQCQALTKLGQRCKLTPMKGTITCRRHSGK